MGTAQMCRGRERKDDFYISARADVFLGEKLICLRQADGELNCGHAELEMAVKDPTRDVQWAVGQSWINSISTT